MLGCSKPFSTWGITTKPACVVPAMLDKNASILVHELVRLNVLSVAAGCLSNPPLLELARIGSLLFIFADSPNDQNGSSSSIDTFATRLSAQPLSSLGLERSPPWEESRHEASGSSLASFTEPRRRGVLGTLRGPGPRRN